MSIHNFPDVSVSDANSGVPVLTPNTDPVNIPTKTYDLVISLGTDYHRFDRLLRWVDAYLKENPHLSCLVQHGHTAPIERGENVRLMPAGDLMAPVRFRMHAVPVLFRWWYHAARSLMRWSITTRFPLLI